MRGTKLSFSSDKNSKRFLIESRWLAWSTPKALSSNSRCRYVTPMRSASGAYISSVSVAIRAFLSSRAKLSIVCILCVRSASLTNKTRISRDIATTNLRKFSACFVFSDCNSRRVNFVTPSTRDRTFAPKSASISSRVTSQSSTVS